jgi:pimeloyl-ACP methyl ester carboxylesterase
MTRCYILLGGFVGKDGYATSAGMYQLKPMLEKLPNTVVTVDTWDDWKTVAEDIRQHPHDKIVVIGYSGGGSRATWMNFYCDTHVDLMVLYDPSPRWQMEPINANVKKAITYENAEPFFLGLGGGVLKGPNVERVPIGMNHMLVQMDTDLHQRTVMEVAKV